MVKVAPLLPSRDLLSSQRQLRWTHTGGLAIWRGDEYILNFLFIYKFSFSLPGRTNYYFPDILSVLLFEKYKKYRVVILRLCLSIKLEEFIFVLDADIF